MQEFLVVFDRRSGKSSVTPFSSSKEAMQARHEKEEENNDPNVEIVVIGARSFSELKQTHSRYFSQEEYADLETDRSWRESLQNLRNLKVLHTAG